MNIVHRNNRIVYHKTQTILAALRHQIDKDYGWEPQPLQYDLDVFFLGNTGQTQPLALLDNPIWPPVYRACQLKAFTDLFMQNTQVCFTTPDNLYAEHDHPYRLTHIVSQFANALMHFNDEIDEDDDPDNFDVKYVENDEDDVNQVIYSFACFLASLTGSTNSRLIAQFAMQLSLFKRCEPSISPFSLPPVCDTTLVGKQVLTWLSHRGDTPVEDLVYQIVWQDEQGHGVAINTTDDLMDKLREDVSRVTVNTVTPVRWDAANEQGIRLSEIMTLSFDASEDTPPFRYLYPLIGLVVKGLNQGAPYNLFDYHNVM